MHEQGDGSTGAWPTVADTTILSLRSSDEHLEFRATVAFEARWTALDPPPPVVLQLAREAITRRAEKLSERRALTEAARLTDEVTTALYAWQQIEGTAVLARGHCVSISTDTELTEAVAARKASARRRTAISWQDEQRIHQIEHASALLLDPLRATASWYLDHQDDPQGLTKAAQEFSDVSTMLGAKAEPDSPGRLVDEFLEITDKEMQERLIAALTKTFERSRADLAVRLTNLWNPVD